MSEAILPTQTIGQEDRQTKDWSPAKMIYAILMAITLLSHIWLILIGAGIDNIPTYIWIIRLLPVPFAIYLGKLWKDRGFQILSLYFFLFFFRCYILNPGSIFSVEVAESILSALWLFAACYGIGRIMDNSQIKKVIYACAVLLIIGMSVLCIVGIYAIWTNQEIKGLGEGFFGLYAGMWQGVYYGRLTLVYLPTTTGAILSISALISLIFFISERSGWKRIFFVFTFLLFIIGVALTDSRTAIISVSFGIGIMGTILVLQRKRQNNTKQLYILIKWLSIVIMCIIISVLMIYIILQISPIFNSIKLKGIIPKALAEETKEGVVLNRGFDNYNGMNGRQEIYRNLFEYIKNNPLVLLTGESKNNPLLKSNSPYGHCHSIVLQILLESGLPGFILFLWFVLLIISKYVRAFRFSNQQLYNKLIIGLPLSLLMGDLVECYIWLRSSHCLMVTVFFISAGIICSQDTTMKSTLNHE